MTTPTPPTEKCCTKCSCTGDCGAKVLDCHRTDCPCHTDSTKKCSCEEVSCKEDCARSHTHKQFFCPMCQPELYSQAFPTPQHTSPENDDWTLSRHPIFLQGGSSVEILMHDKILAGAKDFAERFEGVMKELAEEDTIGSILNDKDTMLEVARKATDDQREQIGLPPLDPNQMMHDLHDEINDGLDKLYAAADWEYAFRQEFALLHEKFAKDASDEDARTVYEHSLAFIRELIAQERKEAKREVVEFLKMRAGEVPETYQYILDHADFEAALTEE